MQKKKTNLLGVGKLVLGDTVPGLGIDLRGAVAGCGRLLLIGEEPLLIFSGCFRWLTDGEFGRPGCCSRDGGREADSGVPPAINNMSSLQVSRLESLEWSAGEGVTNLETFGRLRRKSSTEEKKSHLHYSTKSTMSIEIMISLSEINVMCLSDNYINFFV